MTTFLKRYGKWMFLSLVLVMVAGCATNNQTQPTQPTRETDEVIPEEPQDEQDIIIDNTDTETIGDDESLPIGGQPANNTQSGDGITYMGPDKLAFQDDKAGYESGKDLTGELPEE